MNMKAPLKTVLVLFMIFLGEVYAEDSDRVSVSLYKSILEDDGDVPAYVWKLSAKNSDLVSDKVRVVSYQSLLSEMEQLFSDEFKDVLKMAGRVCIDDIVDLGFFENDASVRLFYHCIAYESERKFRYQGGYIWAVSAWLKDHFLVPDDSIKTQLKLKSGWAGMALLLYVKKLQEE